MQDRARSIAARLIARHGGPAVLVRETAPPSAPWDPPGGTELVPCQFLEGAFELDHIDQTLIQRGDITGLVTGAAPLLSDKLRVRGTDYALLSVHPVQPDTTSPPVHWRVHGRV